MSAVKSIFFSFVVKQFYTNHLTFHLSLGPRDFDRVSESFQVCPACQHKQEAPNHQTFLVCLVFLFFSMWLNFAKRIPIARLGQIWPT